MKLQRTWGLLLGAVLIDSANGPGPAAEETDSPESAAGRVTAKDTQPATPDAAVITAWEKAGAKFCWMGVDQDGFLFVLSRANVKPSEVSLFPCQSDRYVEDVPGFKFSPSLMGESLRGLPQPGTPFAVRYSNATDMGLKKLIGLKQLQWLCVSGSGVTDAGLKALAGLTQLQTLSLGGHRVTDAGLKELAGLRQLRALLLGLPRMTDVGVKEFVGMTQLRSLYLSGAHVTDAGLKELARLTQLQTLILNHTKVTDAGLKELTELTQLRTLHLSHTKVTDAGLKELQEALPNCKIVR